MLKFQNHSIYNQTCTVLQSGSENLWVRNKSSRNEKVSEQKQNLQNRILEKQEVNKLVKKFPVLHKCRQNRPHLTLTLLYPPL
jgi:predicted KAP-like P-loop ATPase